MASKCGAPEGDVKGPGQGRVRPVRAAPCPATLLRRDNGCRAGATAWDWEEARNDHWGELWLTLTRPR